MSVISVDSQRLIIDEEQHHHQHYSRPASRDPWAPPSSFEQKSYDYYDSPPKPEKKITHEIGVQCELPIPVLKPASSDAFTQCCNIGEFFLNYYFREIFILDF